MRRTFWIFSRLVPFLCALFSSSLLFSQPAPEPAAAELHVSRVTGPIEVDGQLGDSGWNGATRVETFYETKPGDNVEPKAKTVAWLGYDDHFFYAAFDFSDPNPGAIRAPVADRDEIASATDYGGVILDTRNDGKTGFMFLANPRGIQYDAISSDSSGEDSSPDFYWDSAARITATGWTLEIRIPFSSLRYNSADVQTWGILLYRNYPRDFRYQMFNSRLPRGSNCFICHSQKMTGLSGLPGGNHVVLAPYATAGRQSNPVAGLGSRLEDEPVHLEAGIDAKWTPNANTAIDATINPDFSQVESDVAQISANERFALFFPEKRPFFLEGLDLFSTPLQAVYTRTITSPRWGLRATGEVGSDTLYTVLVAEDRGGGSVILPGPEFSDLAPQDFSSRVLVGRGRRDFGASFASFLVTDREIEGGGHNRVLGPDFQWRPTSADSVRGQLLVSDSKTPNLPYLASEWDGRDLGSHAAYVSWEHSTQTWDWSLSHTNIGDEFRADLGFLPQVGVRDSGASLGRSVYLNKGPFRQIRPVLRLRNIDDTNNNLLLRRFGPGIELQGFWNSFVSIDQRTEKVRAGGRLFDLSRVVTSISMNPSLRVSYVGLDVVYGDDVDYDNVRPAHGATINLQGSLHPTDHLSVDLNAGRRWLDVSPTGSGPRNARLFTADVARVKATYNFTSRAFLRVIGQQVKTTRDPSLYLALLSRRDEDFSGSALFAYKLNWQTVLFVGYSDERARGANEQLEPAGRAVFLKVSYAFQR